MTALTQCLCFQPSFVPWSAWPLSWGVGWKKGVAGGGILSAKAGCLAWILEVTGAPVGTEGNVCVGYL